MICTVIGRELPAARNWSFSVTPGSVHDFQGTYLLQSTVLALVFTGYGFSAVGHLSPAVVLALTLTLYAAQLWLSSAWMRTHAYGPVEWWLRAATNLTIPAWKRPGSRHHG
ncbi:DUF418 domain-containing protein [Streptomyces sp. NPDC060077]|uniref:DUF418 domain-containing protein n=1 Tax=Streptomyces sp. NPDC060077 TaxID=3347052 RepID=UPI0036484EEC